MLRTLLSEDGASSIHPASYGRPRRPVSARLLFRSVRADDPVRPVSLSLRRGRRPRRPVSARLLFRSVGADDPVHPVSLSFRRGQRPRRPVSARLLFRSVGADDSVRPVPLSFRASARTGVGIRFPLPPSARGVAARSAAALTGRRTPRAFVPLRSTAGRRPLRAVRRTCPVGRLALRRFPVMQCAHLTFRRQQASSHPLTCHGMVPQASRTELFRTRQNPATSVAGFRVDATYLPRPSPAKYCRQKRA